MDDGALPATLLAARRAETFEAKVWRVLAEEIVIAPYDPNWPVLFEEEARHLRACLPPEMIGRIEHFGSTAVPGLAAKPIVDMLVEVTDLEAARSDIVPVLEAQGYDYFRRPCEENPGAYFAWLIKRNANDVRTHHIHMVEADLEHWDRLRFRDYLRAHPEAAAEYQTLKYNLAEQFRHDREGYTAAKSDFIATITANYDNPNFKTANKR
jgi:GrpB-like predicted nucleotidyltransferase (UPF0157 family)